MAMNNTLGRVAAVPGSSFLVPGCGFAALECDAVLQNNRTDRARIVVCAMVFFLIFI
jgi:hypothetical protein